MNSNNLLETLPTNSSAVSQISQPNEDKVETITSLKLLAQINLFRNQSETKSELGHNDLLKIIRDEFEEEIELGKISQCDYQGENNRKYPMFVLTFEQAKQVLARESKVVRKAVFEYIKSLEDKIKALTSQKDNLTLQLFSTDRFVVATAHKALVELETRPLLARIEEDKPMVEFATQIAISQNTIEVGQFAKLLPEAWDLGEKKLYALLRDKEICLSSKKEWNKPTQEVIKAGYFKVDERSYINPATFKPVTYFVTKITGKGQVWISNKLKNWGYAI